MSSKRPPLTYANSGEGADKFSQLSQRQRDIADHYAKGLTQKQIADELFIAPSTVRNHLAAIYRSNWKVKTFFGLRSMKAPMFVSWTTTTYRPSMATVTSLSC